MKQPEADKLGHFRMGLIWLAIFTPFFGIEIASLLVVFVMAAKEVVWDWRLSKGTPEWLDFWHGIEPVVIVWFIIKLKDLYLFKKLLIFLK